MSKYPTDLEKELKAALGSPTPTLEVPEERNVAISAMIRQRSEAIQKGRGVKDGARRSKGIVRWVLPLAAVASIALALGLSRIAIESEKTPFMSQVVAVKGDDINGDGQVDIVDAFILARTIETGGTVDGLDQADVDRIAGAAVALDGGGSR